MSKVVRPTAAQAEVALEASFELEALAGVLLRELRGPLASEEDIRLRPLAIRVRDLARVVGTAMNDTPDAVAGLREVLAGV